MALRKSHFYCFSAVEERDMSSRNLSARHGGGLFVGSIVRADTTSAGYRRSVTCFCASKRGVEELGSEVVCVEHVLQLIPQAMCPRGNMSAALPL